MSSSTPSAPAARRAATALGGALALAAALAGCASPAGIVAEGRPLTSVQAGLPADDAGGPTAALAAAWWRGFGDSTLDGLVERALADHPSLRAAQARVARADAALAGQQSRDGLQVQASADATRQRFSANSIYPPPLGGSTRTLANAQLAAGWEFDFFGRHRADIEAALGTRRAAEAEAAAARVALATRVTRQYLQLARLQAQRDVAEGTLTQREALRRLVQQRVDSGLDTRVELRQSEGALPETRNQIEQLDEQIALTRHALAALTAQPPDALDRLTAPLQALRPQALPARLPADLLARRADIAAARARIEASAADVRSARAGFYPDIDLSAFVGLSSIGLDRLLRGSSQQWGVGPAVHLPIFDAGRLRAQLRAKTADADAAVEAYNGAVLDAVHEAADGVTSVRAVQRQQAQQAQARTAAEAAYDLATQRYRAGLGTYLTVLAAEGGVLNQRRLAVDLQARALDAQVALIAALGGGHTDTPATTAAAPVSPPAR